MGGGGGLFRRLETTSNNLDPDFGRSLLRLNRFFLPNLGDLQKKVFCHAEIQLFLSKSHRFLYQFSSPIPMGGTIFVFRAKIGLKSTKNVVFCILFRPMGEGYSPLFSWLRYWCSCKNNATCSSKGDCCNKSQEQKAELTFDNVNKYCYGLCEASIKTRYNNH